jgi:hypothetical protein
MLENPDGAARSFAWLRVASRLLLDGATRRDARRKETTMQKKRFKVMCMLPRKDGGTTWMRCGSAATNKDDSINVYLDVLPRGEWKFQLRELDEVDLSKREPNAHASPAAGARHGNEPIAS